MSLVLSIISLGMPFLLTRETWIPGMDFMETGQIGDTIGGTTAPFVGLLTACLTFAAFWIQYEFNKQQNKRIDDQERDSKTDRFEARFYELLKIHREIVSEILINDGLYGRRAFISMFKEFRFCYLELYTYCKANNNYFESLDIKMNDKDILNISYVAFFYGIGESANNIFNSVSYVKTFEELINNYYINLHMKRIDWEGGMNKKSLETNEKPNSFSIRTSFMNSDKSYNFTTLEYLPFEGHATRINHYFNNLLNLVEYVDGQNNYILNNEEKQKYLKIIRSQLSIHEQLLLHYHSMTVIGDSWIVNRNNENYIKKFGLIRDIPLPLADFGPDIESIYDDANFFEWKPINAKFIKMKD